MLDKLTENKMSIFIHKKSLFLTFLYNVKTQLNQEYIFKATF